MTNIAIIGMGGFAGAHQDAVKALESEGVCRLISTCDPDPDSFAVQMRNWEFERRGVNVYRDYLQMLEETEGIDIVTVPTPINLHAAMHAAGVERGLAVYLEKPPTLDYQELQSMLEVEQHARKSTNVGFNYIIEAPRQALKQRILNGEFGPLRRIELLGNWPRLKSYFTRNQWAGRLKLGQKLVLDSIMGNAMAHYVHNALFWAGEQELFSWAPVQAVESQLYRANEIEGADTVFLRAGLCPDIELRVALSHACSGEQKQYERLIFDEVVLQYDATSGYSISGVGVMETGESDKRNLLMENLRHYCLYVQDQVERPITKLSDCVPFVHINDLAYIAAARITAVPLQYVTEVSYGASEDSLSEILNIAAICDKFLLTGAFPTDQNVNWAEPGGKATAKELCMLHDTIEDMVGRCGMV